MRIKEDIGFLIEPLWIGVCIFIFIVFGSIMAAGSLLPNVVYPFYMGYVGAALFLVLFHAVYIMMYSGFGFVNKVVLHEKQKGN